MKKIYLLFFCILTTQLSWGQLDSTYQKTTTEEAVFEPQILVDAKSSYLQLQSKEKRIFRFGLEANSIPVAPYYRSSFPYAQSFYISFEQRLKTGFSLVSSLNYQQTFNYFSIIFVQPAEYSLYSHKTHSIGLTLSPRWYFNKKKEMALQKSGHNFNGWYAGLSLGAQKWWQPMYFYKSTDGSITNIDLTGITQFGSIDLGWQRRFGKRGFLKFQLGTGISRTQRIITNFEVNGQTIQLPTLPKWQWISNYTIGLGWAFGGQIDDTSNKPFWEYRKDDADMWKVNLFSLFSILSKDGITGKLSLGYEKRIKQSPFSMNTNILYLHIKSDYSNHSDRIIFQVAPRYYYNLKKRMRKSKSANNLSADYFSIRHQWGIDNTNPYNSTIDISKKYSIQFIWGVQRRLFERMYVDYQIIYDFKDRYNYLSSKDVFLTSDLKIGLAF